MFGSASYQSEPGNLSHKLTSAVKDDVCEQEQEAKGYQHLGPPAQPPRETSYPGESRHVCAGPSTFVNLLSLGAMGVLGPEPR